MQHKDEGYKVILVNSNPATIMTDPGVADKTYIEPISIGSRRNNKKEKQKQFSQLWEDKLL